MDRIETAIIITFCFPAALFVKELISFHLGRADEMWLDQRSKARQFNRSKKAKTKKRLAMKRKQMRPA
mgnify:CR=1 FL=1